MMATPAITSSFPSSLSGQIRDQILEIIQGVLEYCPDHPPLMSLKTHLHDPVLSSGTIGRVASFLKPISTHITNCDALSIDKVYPSYEVMRAHDAIPEGKRDMLWKSISMLQILVNMVEAMPEPVLQQVDAITANIMGMMNLGGAGSVGKNDDENLQNVLSSLGPMLSGLIGGIGGFGGGAGGNEDAEEDGRERVADDTQAVNTKNPGVLNRANDEVLMLPSGEMGSAKKKKKRGTTGNPKRDSFIEKVC